MKSFLLIPLMLMMVYRDVYCQTAAGSINSEFKVQERGELLRSIAEDYLSNIALYDGKKHGPAIRDSAIAVVLNRYRDFIQSVSVQVTQAYEQPDSLKITLEERIAQLKQLADPVSKEIELLYYQKIAAEGNKELYINIDSVATVVQREIVTRSRSAQIQSP